MPRKSRHLLVAGNWKMNGSLVESRKLVDALKGERLVAAADMLVCPPYPYLQAVKQWLTGTR